MANHSNSANPPITGQIQLVVFTVLIASLVNSVFADSGIVKLFWATLKGVITVLFILLILAISRRSLRNSSTRTDLTCDSDNIGVSEPTEKAQTARRRQNRQKKKRHGPRNPIRPPAADESSDTSWNATAWPREEYPRPWNTPLPLSRQIEPRGPGEYSRYDWVNWDDLDFRPAVP